MKITKILIFVSLLFAFVACKDDSAENPVFKKGEVYIYDNKPVTLTAVQGTPASWPMIIAPNDGSVNCTWLLDGVEIAWDRDLEYTFTKVGGPFVLRFEAKRDEVVNYREFQLTVSAAAL